MRWLETFDSIPEYRSSVLASEALTFLYSSSDLCSYDFPSNAFGAAQ